MYDVCVSDQTCNQTALRPPEDRPTPSLSFGSLWTNEGWWRPYCTPLLQSSFTSLSFFHLLSHLLGKQEQDCSSHFTDETEGKGLAQKYDHSPYSSHPGSTFPISEVLVLLSSDHWRSISLMYVWPFVAPIPRPEVLRNLSPEIWFCISIFSW